MLNLQELWSDHNLLFSVPYCLLLDGIIKETTCNVMVDHLQSRVMPWGQYASHVKVRGTSSKMDAPLLILFRVGCSEVDKYI